MYFQRFTKDREVCSPPLKRNQILKGKQLGMLIGSFTSPETSIVCIPSHPERSESELWLSFLFGWHLLCQQVSSAAPMCPHRAELWRAGLRARRHSPTLHTGLGIGWC